MNDICLPATGQSIIENDEEIVNGHTEANTYDDFYTTNSIDFVDEEHQDYYRLFSGEPDFTIFDTVSNDWEQVNNLAPGTSPGTWEVRLVMPPVTVDTHTGSITAE